MNKTWLIFKREYLSRVRKKSFILTTILTPLGFAALMAVLMLLMSSGQEEITFGVIDPQNTLQLNSGRSLRDSKYTHFRRLNTDLQQARDQADSLKIDAILYLPPATDTQNLRNLRLEYYHDEQIGVATLDYVKSTLAAHLKDIKIQRFGLDQQVLASLNTDVELAPKALRPDEDGSEDKGSSTRIYIASFLGFVSMMLIYVMVFIYGQMVMRSVMEEKTNRIVEVIISSVKPFPLMLGKILGVGAVGLTQFSIWAILTPLLSFVVSLFFLGNVSDMQSNPAFASQMNAADLAANQQMAMNIAQEIGSFNFWLLIPMFLFYFVVGYILFASIFAALGSMMNDDWGEGQSLVLVVSIPIILAFYVGVAALQNPNGTLATLASILPPFSPVVMPARMVFDPPIWQVLLSMSLLLAACAAFVWLAGRIYRVGILLYGNKPSLLQFFKWIFVKD